MHMHSSTRQAQNASTRRPTRRRGNHMHDHSRFQRDMDDVTGVSLSLLLLVLLLTKVTHAQYRKRFRAAALPIIIGLKV